MSGARKLGSAPRRVRRGHRCSVPASIELIMPNYFAGGAPRWFRIFSGIFGTVLCAQAFLFVYLGAWSWMDGAFPTLILGASWLGIARTGFYLQFRRPVGTEPADAVDGPASRL